MSEKLVLTSLEWVGSTSGNVHGKCRAGKPLFDDEHRAHRRCRCTVALKAPEEQWGARSAVEPGMVTPRDEYRKGSVTLRKLFRSKVGLRLIASPCIRVCGLSLQDSRGIT